MDAKTQLKIISLVKAAKIKPLKAFINDCMTECEDDSEKKEVEKTLFRAIIEVSTDDFFMDCMSTFEPAGKINIGDMFHRSMSCVDYMYMIGISDLPQRLLNLAVELHDIEKIEFAFDVHNDSDEKIDINEALRCLTAEADDNFIVSLHKTLASRMYFVSIEKLKNLKKLC